MKVIPISSAAGYRARTDAGRQAGRLLLPVAPRANSRIRFAAAEKPEPALQPAEALAVVGRLLDQGAQIELVMIAGPGDPLATPLFTNETLRLVRERYPDLPLGITTLGINGEECARELAANGVRSVTLLVDAVDAEVVKSLYAWIRPGTKTVPLARAAELLLSEQAAAITAFRQAGCAVTVSTTVYPGCNDGHIEEIAQRAAALGAEAMMLNPFEPEAEESDTPVRPDPALMEKLRRLAAQHIAVDDGIEQTAPDLVNTIYQGDGGALAMALPKPSSDRPNVAVMSSNGMDVDLHLGHAIKALIYGPRPDGLACLLETRWLPEPGGGSARWEELAGILKDCFALLAAGAGNSPRNILSRHGISVLITDDNIEGAVDVLYGGGKKGKKQK